MTFETEEIERLSNEVATLRTVAEQVADYQLLLNIADAAQGLVGAAIYPQSTVSDVLGFPKWRIQKLMVALGKHSGRVQTGPAPNGA